MAVQFASFAGQNWTITPAALAVNETRPSTISDQTWVVVFTGVGILDLKGNNANDWRREILHIFPNITAPLQHAIDKYSIPRPVGLNTAAHIELEQWAPFAAVSSTFEEDTNDAGFAVDVWRPNPFFSAVDAAGTPRNRLFTGILVDLAVRNNRAVMHRVSYHFTLIGKIVFLPSA